MALKPSSFTPITHLQIPISHTQFLHPTSVFPSPSFPTKLLSSKLHSPRKSSVFTNSLKQETLQNPNPSSASSNKLVLVTGGTGGVGQLVVASLLDRDVKLRLLLRNPEKATTLFGEQEEDKLQ